jgi:hypothetical protein
MRKADGAAFEKVSGPVRYVISWLSATTCGLTFKPRQQVDAKYPSAETAGLIERMNNG